ncbi:MAG: linear amide C-N hydrolase, partial [Muribaculaceae bacterium]|nr:linear amide C-N hydrolase [Muribaculaceae bacterium]
MKTPKLSLGLLAVALTAAFAPVDTDACTRVVYTGDDGTVITGRTLDWKEDIATNLYVLPQGITRSSYDDPAKSLT